MNHIFLDRAEQNLPRLYEREVVTNQIVTWAENPAAFFGAQAIPQGVLAPHYETGDRFVLDFGQHCVGTLSFSFRHDQRFLDAPVRLKLRFGEIPYELYRSFESYQGGLSSSWLQEEIINLDVPGRVELPRRYTFRYLEVTVAKSPRPVCLFDFAVRCTTSADWSRLQPLPEGTDPELVAIDRVAAKTLADCMQTAYEDGPKRDRRLWSGDLRLQALTDYTLFRNDRLARRCLYLFAACLEDGKFLPGCLYQKPIVFYDEGMGITDYALLFCASVSDYYENTGDLKTLQELFPVVENQIELALSLLDPAGVITFLDGWNGFIDWADDIQRTTAIEGVLLYTLEKVIPLASAMNREKLAQRWQEMLNKTRIAAKKALFDEEKGYFCNPYDENQYSVHAQVWMILGGVITGPEGVRALKESLASPLALQPVTPYMHHYVVEAMIRLGLRDDAAAYVKHYWGGMIRNGADTFWEVYVPGKAEVSPYQDALMNSFCHAWSCSASYFIRKYFVPNSGSPGNQTGF